MDGSESTCLLLVSSRQVEEYFLPRMIQEVTGQVKKKQKNNLSSAVLMKDSDNFFLHRKH